MAAISQNGWPVLAPDDTEVWVLPFREGDTRYLRLRPGYCGFVLAYLALWFHERIEKLNLGIWDEWAYAYRAIRGQTEGFSNHASGTAIDLNATVHPLGKRGTFTKSWQYARIRARLVFLQGVVRWGGDYTYRADEMHFEINVPPRSGRVRRLARILELTPRGKRILRANKHYSL